MKPGRKEGGGGCGGGDPASTSRHVRVGSLVGFLVVLGI